MLFIWLPNDNLWYPFLNRMAVTSKPIDWLVGNILSVAISASVNHTHVAINIVDCYLDNTCKKERDHIVQFMKYNNANSDALLLGYVSEAMHASANIPFFWL